MKQLSLLCLLLSLLSACQPVSKPKAPPVVEDEEPARPPEPVVIPSKVFDSPTQLEYFEEVIEDEENVGPNFNLVSAFYPIGWSRTSKFAYLREPAIEASDEYRFELIVQDVVSDRELANYTMENYDMEPLDSVWARHSDTLRQILNAHQIEAQEGFQLGAAKFEHAGKSYEMLMKTVMKKSEYFDEQVVDSQMLWAKSPELGRKLIFQDEKQEFSMTLGVAAIGHLKSPFAPLVMAVVREQQRGYEGPPHVMNFHVIGCHLEENFE